MDWSKGPTNLVGVLEKRAQKKQQARDNFCNFIQYIKPAYHMSWFHKTLGESLDKFANDLSAKRQMIFAPPQHGKSDQSSRSLPAYLLGKNPSMKIALLSYSSLVATGFSNDIQKIIESDSYRELFPDTKIDGVGCKRGTLKRNGYEFHTSEGGYVISVGAGGPLTSKTVDIAIIDDLYKSHVEAWSSTHRERIENWYWSVLETRLHNNSKILLLYTRWHEDDLAGNLLKSEANLWAVERYEILKTGLVDNPKDIRQIGEALWPEKHSKEKALRWKQRDPRSFEALGQQNPKPSEGYLYEGFKMYNSSDLKTVQELGVLKSYTDTADTGTDYLATYIFYEYMHQAYVVDVIYTQKDMKVTIPLWAEVHAQNKVLYAFIEYNNGGHPFKLYAEDKMINQFGWKHCKIKGFHQSENKLTRILSQSAWVQENVFFPEHWNVRWPVLYQHLHTFMREGKNEHDDCADALTGVAEIINKGIKQKVSAIVNPFNN